MINQKPISVKVYTNLLEALDEECYVACIKRNAAINAAIDLYIKEADRKRNTAYWQAVNAKKLGEQGGRKVYTIKEPDGEQAQELALTAANLDFLRNYAKVVGKSASYVISQALLVLQADYEKRPFAHLP